MWLHIRKAENKSRWVKKTAADSTHFPFKCKYKCTLTRVIGNKDTCLCTWGDVTQTLIDNRLKIDI